MVMPQLTRLAKLRSPRYMLVVPYRRNCMSSITWPARLTGLVGPATLDNMAEVRVLVLRNCFKRRLLGKTLATTFAPCDCKNGDGESLVISRDRLTSQIKSSFFLYASLKVSWPRTILLWGLPSRKMSAELLLVLIGNPPRNLCLPWISFSAPPSSSKYARSVRLSSAISISFTVLPGYFVLISLTCSRSIVSVNAVVLVADAFCGSSRINLLGLSGLPKREESASATPKSTMRDRLRGPKLPLGFLFRFGGGRAEASPSAPPSSPSRTLVLEWDFFGTSVSGLSRSRNSTSTWATPSPIQ
mmetsp:Transcript_15747/g.27996  ORF Transcript_15747/g.27996 Transcript_15747/m.27996 type:complete len:301 (-) Transcript_15747:538-1440(-)